MVADDTAENAQSPFAWCVLVPVLVLAAAVSSIVVLDGPLGLLLFALVAIFAYFLNRMAVLCALVCFGAVLFGLGLFSTLISRAGEAAFRMSCVNNLKQISLALINYEHANKFLPPAYIADKNGRRMHSWRVLILPYFEGEELHKQYNWNEPWDGPNNKKLLDAMPKFFHCPSNKDGYPRDWTCTDYVAVVGGDPASFGAKSGSLRGPLVNAASNTVMIVEVSDAHIPWTEPRDLDWDALRANRSPDCVTVSSRHESHGDYFHQHPRPGANVAMTDCSVRFLPGEILTPERLLSLLRTGGFHDDESDARLRAGGRDIHWPHCIGLAVWVVSSGWLFVCAGRDRMRRQRLGSQEAAGGLTPGVTAGLPSSNVGRVRRTYGAAPVDGGLAKLALARGKGKGDTCQMPNLLLSGSRASP